jgi:predicted RNA-binding Zn-ribbon protein involved in translation (DUF1610 family)
MNVKGKEMRVMSKKVSGECIYSDFPYFRDKEKSIFICPNCGSVVVLNDATEEYRDSDTLIVTEHYNCPICGIVPKERVATYELRKEVWTDEMPQL